MNNEEIRKILRKTLPEYFLDTYASNTIPTQPRHKYPYCLVANTDPLGRKGTHWVAIWVQNASHAEYFDPLGNVRGTPPPIAEYLLRYPQVKGSDYKIQKPLSISCGPYCIYFLRARAFTRSYEKVVRGLAANPHSDAMVRSYVSNLVSGAAPASSHSR